MGFFSSLYRIISDNFKSFGTTFLGHKTEEEKANERYQDQMLRDTKEQKNIAQREKDLELAKVSKLKKRATRGRRSVLFQDEEGNDLKETLG